MPGRPTRQLGDSGSDDETDGQADDRRGRRVHQPLQNAAERPCAVHRLLEVVHEVVGGVPAEFVSTDDQEGSLSHA